MNKVLCITGMHRSGTSLTASWIQQCGLQIDNGNLIGAAVGNELGHFEDGDFVKLHSKYMLKLWPGSKNWIVHRHRQIDREMKDAFMQEAVELVNTRNSRYEFWGWKDPRSVIFLDMWKELIPNLNALLIWRDASDVLDSLIRRSKKANHPVYKIGSYTSLLVWKYYNERLLGYYKEHTDDSIVVNISDILRNDQIVIRAIGDKLNLNVKYSRIMDLVQDSMLRQGISGRYVDFLSRILGVNQIEGALREVSLRE